MYRKIHKVLYSLKSSPRKYFKNYMFCLDMSIKKGIHAYNCHFINIPIQPIQFLPYSKFKIKYENTVVVVQRRRLLISILISSKHFSSLDTHKHGNKKKLLINFVSLFSCNFKKAKSKLEQKSYLHCININAVVLICKCMYINVVHIYIKFEIELYKMKYKYLVYSNVLVRRNYILNRELIQSYIQYTLCNTIIYIRCINVFMSDIYEDTIH